MNSLPVRFRYQVPTLRSFAGFFLAIGLVIGFGYMAYTNQKGLRIGLIIQIPYSAITRIRAQDIQKEQMLIVDSAAGQSRIMSGGFDNGLAFAEFKRLLEARLNG